MKYELAEISLQVLSQYSVLDNVFSASLGLDLRAPLQPSTPTVLEGPGMVTAGARGTSQDPGRHVRATRDNSELPRPC